MQRKIGLLLPPGFQALDLMAITVFELANAISCESHYSVQMLSEAGGIMRSSSGVGVLTEAAGDGQLDTLLVAGDRKSVV